MKNKIMYAAIVVFCLLQCLTLPAQRELYGLTTYGGDYGHGTIFKTDSNGANVHILYSFDGVTAGGALGSLTLANNGKLYGLTSGGGTYGGGVLFQYDLQLDSFTVKVNLQNSPTGVYPRGSLLQASDGNLYATTSGIAAQFFQYNPVNDSVKGFNYFWWTEVPVGGLIEVNHVVYGVTENGGGNGASGYQGRLFKFNLSTQVFTYIHDFYTLYGYVPGAPPALWSNGLLYGTTRGGGTYGHGVIYTYNVQTNAYTQLLSLSDSFIPYDGRLLLAADNKFYGITYNGAPPVNGFSFATLFQFDPATSSIKRIYNFRDDQGALTGTYGRGELMQASNGKIYGTTEAGIFEYDYNNHDTVILRSYSQLNLQNTATHLIEVCTPPAYRYYADSVFTLCAGTPVSFQLHSAHTEAVQWLHNGVVDAGRTTDTLNFNHITMADSGVWQCVLTNQCGTTRPPAFTLHINAAGSGTVTSTLSPTGPLLICPGSSVVLSGNNGGLWYNGDTTATLTATKPGNYQVINNNACGQTFSNIVRVDTIVAPQAPRPAYYIDDLVLCSPGDSAMLFGNTDGVWSTGATTDTIYVTQPGTYYITKNNGCVTDTSDGWQNPTVTTLLLPVIYAYGPVQLCGGDSVELSAYAGYPVVWSNNVVGQWQYVKTTGTYYCTMITPACGNIQSNSIDVLADSVALDTVFITPQGPTTFCLGDSVILKSNVAFSVWSTGDTGTTITAKTGGQYQVTGINGCSSLTSEYVNVDVDLFNSITPNIYTSGYNTLCTGDSSILTTMPALNYLWSTGSTQASIVVYNAGTYAVTLSDSLGCQATSTPTIIQVTSIPAPVPYITVDNGDSMCQGSNKFLTANGAVHYVWSTGAIGPVINVDTAGWYFVTAYSTIGGGCTATSIPVYISVFAAPPPPVVQINGPDTFCAGSGVTIGTTTPGWDYYHWTSGDSTPTITPRFSGSYQLIVVTTTGCYALSTPVVVTVIGRSFHTISDSLCYGQTYNFRGGLLTTTGTYYDTLTNVAGCDSVVTLNLHVGALPVISNIGSNMLITDSFATYQWLLNGIAITNSTLQSCEMVATGDYQVIVTDVNGCTDTSAAYHFINTANVQQQVENKIRIVPNPTHGMFTVEIPDGAERITILNTLGEEILSTTPGRPKQMVFELSSSGVYMIQIYTGQRLITKRIVVEQ